MEFGLEDKILSMLSEYFKSQTNIDEVKIYGSRIKGTFKNGSDIDLAFFGHNLNETKIKADLENLPTAYSFDVCIFDKLQNENLKKEITQNGKVIYERK